MMLDRGSGEKEFLMVKKSAWRTPRRHNPVFKARVALAGADHRRGQLCTFRNPPEAHL